MTTIIGSIQLRNCFRCGTEFRCEGGKRICPICAAPKDAKRPLNPTLSFREKQVVNLICKAKLNKEIAYELHLTEGTVKEYLNRIFRKVGATNRTELAVWAITTQGGARVAANGPMAMENCQALNASSSVLSVFPEQAVKWLLDEL
jgi:DNA-binding CsgD family transcriptional regulator